MTERHDNWSKDDDVRWQFGVMKQPGGISLKAPNNHSIFPQ